MCGSVKVKAMVVRSGAANERQQIQYIKKTVHTNTSQSDFFALIPLTFNEFSLLGGGGGGIFCVC